MPKPVLNERFWELIRPEQADVKNETMLSDVLGFIEGAEKDFKKAATPANAEALKAFLFKLPAAADAVSKGLDRKAQADCVKSLAELSKLAQARGKEIGAQAKADAKTPEAGAPDPKQPMKLSANVGAGEANKAADVLAVQAKLVKHGAKIAVDGKFGPKTTAAILKFQEKFMKGEPGPTGIVEPGSETAKQLNK